MKYKISNNLQEFEQINAYAATKPYTEKYSEITKHCKFDLWAVVFDRQILESYPLPFITEDWLTCDIVETLPAEWTWHSPPKTMRFVIPNAFIIKSFREQNDFNTVMENMRTDALTDPDLLIIENEAETIVYANSVSAENETVVSRLIADGIIKVEQQTWTRS